MTRKEREKTHILFDLNKLGGNNGKHVIIIFAKKKKNLIDQ